ncbi:MAG TPA: class I tRNA ligase family protein, partial [Bacteroidia bacterium]|nr:class I tRNA ligase family protein [Bacteroidia bacterium]
TTYKLVWDDFCAWYLEMIKPDFVDGKAKPIDGKTFLATTDFFEKILKVLHPFMPFITEELYHHLADREERDAIIVAKWPGVEKFDQAIIDRFAAFMESVIGVRSIRNEKNISPKEPLELFIRIPENPVSKKLEGAIKKLCNISTIHYTDKKVDNASSFIVSGIEFYVPLPNNFDLKAEKEKLKKELEYNQGFLQSVQKKLANEKFVANAKPELIELERRKQSDAESKIKAIQAQLANL